MGWELCLDPKERGVRIERTKLPFPDCTMYRREKPYEMKTSCTKGGNFLLKLIEKTPNPLIGVFFFLSLWKKKRNRDREQAILQGDSEIAEAWFDQAEIYIEAQNWKVDLLKLKRKKRFFLAGLFVCLVRKEEDLMIIRSSEPEVKIAVDRDPIKTSFEEWARPGISQEQYHTGDLEEISRKVFSAHFGQLSIIFLWLSGMYFHGARFSNYEAWLSDPTHIGPSAQVVWPIVGQEILNGDIWRASGITSELQLYCTAIGALIFASLMLFAGWFHYHKAAPKLAWFQDVESMLNHHLAGLLGLWNRDLLAQLYPSFAEGATPFFTLNCDIAHHHLAIAILFLIAGHMAHLQDKGHKGLYEILTTSWHAQLSLNLAMLGSTTIVVAHHIDYDPTTRYNDLLDRVLRHRDAIISHLNWVCIFLGFHSFGLYIHNDTMSALGRPQDMFSDTAIQLQPIFAQWIQNIHAGAPGVTAPGATTSTSLTWGGGELVAIGGKGTADFLVHHIHAFTIHVTVLILLKGVLFARSSRLIPDKANLGFRFPCDGPGRGEHVKYPPGIIWKMQSDVWGTISDQGIISCGAQASQVIQSYGAHFVWAFSLIALSIIQGRAVGVTHYLLGGIASTCRIGLAQDPTTRRIWFGIATAHDFESHDDITEERLYQNIFASHFGQLAIIFLWTSGNLFHVAWQGNFESWIQDPLHVRPIAHAIWDPHFGQPAVEAFTRGGAAGPVNIAYSGVYQWWYTIGLRTNEDLYTGSSFSIISFYPSLSWFKNAESRLNHHLSGLFGVSSLAWTGHLVHVAIPDPGGSTFRWNNFLDVLPYPQGLGPLLTGQWNLYAQNPDSSNHLFGTTQGAGTAILTLLGGFHPQTQSLWLTDIAHHHLAIAFIFLIAGHMYRTNFGIGHRRGHKGLYDTINNSIHFQLGLALASLGVITSLVAQHIYFFIRDYNPEQNEDNVLARMLDHKEAIISHLSWASLFLGFHTLGLYVHNDVMLAFGTPEKQILIEPIFAQWIQSAHGKTTYGFDILLSSTNGPAFNAGRNIWLPGWLNAVNENSNSLFLTIGPGDFLVHHAIALGLHTTTLILVKGALDARGSKLMPDKKDFGYSFPCDGPGRGGTCDISAWDAFYLAVFWMLNTIGWVTFYWHWKHITLWQGNVSQFNESSTYLMGWLRDYLWLNSSQLINGYNPFGMNSLSVWAWMFLFGHLVWATGFMFLISWRGYWQELIETLAWAHERTPLANLIRWRDKPVALSIVQARLVGLAHFSVGYIFTYAAFLIASTSGKFG
ncbi:hypothetical protein ACJX0J_005155 [Zea mays]